jgi:hypothetical protein
MIAIPTDQYDKDGNMLGIEFNDGEGKFIIFAEWDPTDEQTSEKRIAFREWAYKALKNN